MCMCVVLVFGNTGSTQRLNWAAFMSITLVPTFYFPMLKKKEKNAPVSPPLVRSPALDQRTEL